MKVIFEDFDKSRDCMDAQIGGIEDYLGLPEGEVQSIWLWDGQNVNCIRYMRGAEYQARDKHHLQEYGQEYKIQGQCQGTVLKTVFPKQPHLSHTLCL